MKASAARPLIAAVVAFVTLALGAGAARAEAVSFSSEGGWFRGTSLQSSEVPGLTFRSSAPGGLVVTAFGSRSDGNALAIWSASATRLIMDFAAPATAFSMRFGNDDPRFVPEGSRAWLTASLTGGDAGGVSVAMNLDDVMNQIIAFDGIFDRLEFFYMTATGAPVRAAELVDDIRFAWAGGGAVADVAEPATVALLGAGFVGLFGAGRLARRRRA